MNKKPLSTQRRRGERGMAMMEVLISMLLIAGWMLSNAGLQMGALKFQKSAESRLRAISLFTELAERMEANVRGARAGDYALAATSTATTSTSNCATSTCQPTQLATYDLAQWTARAASTVKITAMSVEDVTPAGGITTYRISLSWEEPRGRQRYASAGDGQAATEVMSYFTTKAVRNATF
jgi:type IV pilus assembly protein PilV